MKDINEDRIPVPKISFHEALNLPWCKKAFLKTR